MATKGVARKREAKTVGASVLTKEDADRFEKSATAWGKRAARTKKSARETLVSLGIVTPEGRLTKKYGYGMFVKERPMNNDNKICTGDRSYWMEVGETDTEAYLLTVHFGPFANRKEAEAFGDLLDQEKVFSGKVLIQ